MHEPSAIVPRPGGTSKWSAFGDARIMGTKQPTALIVSLEGRSVVIGINAEDSADLGLGV